MILTVRTCSAQETIDFGKALGMELQPKDVILLTGDLGAGKTQIAKGIGASLSVDNSITSPTFTILNTYKGSLYSNTDKHITLNHFDLYRLQILRSLESVGYWESIDADDVITLTEWGDRFPQAMPDDYLLIQVERVSDDERVIVTVGKGIRSTGRLRRFAQRAVKVLPNATLAGPPVRDPGLSE